MRTNTTPEAQSRGIATQIANTVKQNAWSSVKRDGVIVHSHTMNMTQPTAMPGGGRMNTKQAT